MSDEVIGYLLALASLVSFTASIMVTRLATPFMSMGLGFVVSTAVNVIVAGLLVLIQQIWRAHPIGWHAQAFWLFAAAGVCATFMGRWLFYEAVARFGPERTSVFQIGIPVFTAALAWLLFDERLSAPALLGMGMAVTGLMIVGYKRGANAPRSPTGQLSVVHSLLALGFGSSLAYASGNLMRGYAVREWPEPVLGALVGAVAGLILHLAVTPGKRDLVQQLMRANRRGFWLFVVVGMGNIGGQVFMIGAMRHIEISVAVLLTMCTPLLVFPLSRWMFANSEPWTFKLIGGSLLAMAGVVLVVLR
jgi:drug/metabolite transporter (DMT)-like permease